MKCILLLLLLTALRPGAFLPASKGAGYLKLKHITSVQPERGKYVIEGEGLPLKGAAGPTRTNWTTSFTIQPPSKTGNPIYDLPARLVALLVYRGNVLDATTGEAFPDIAAFQRSRQARFEPWPPKAPVFCKPTRSGSCERDSPLDQTAANRAFHDLCRKVGLPGSRLYNFRKGAAMVWEQALNAEAARGPRSRQGPKYAREPLSALAAAAGRPYEDPRRRRGGR